MSDLTVLSAQAPLWKALVFSAAERDVLEEHLQRQSLQAGEALWTEGETTPNRMGILQSGRIKALKNNIFGSGNIVMGVLEPGTIIGLPLTSDDVPKGVTLVAMERCELLMMGDAVFEHLMAEHLSLGLRLLKHIHTDYVYKMKFVADRLVQTF